MTPSPPGPQGPEAVSPGLDSETSRAMTEERFWKESYGRRIEDLDPRVFETDTIRLFSQSLAENADRTALIFMGVEVSFGQLDAYANVFANM